MRYPMIKSYVALCHFGLLGLFLVGTVVDCVPLSTSSSEYEDPHIPINTSTAAPIDDQPSADGCYQGWGCFSKSGIRFTPYPQSPEWVKTEYLRFDLDDPTKITHSFSASNDTEGLLKHLACDTANTHQMAFKNVTILIHGFSENFKRGRNHSAFSQLKNTLIETLPSVQVGDHLILAVNWARGAAAPDYAQAAVNTRLVGRQVARMVAQLITRKCVRPESIHLIGFSLGAHTCGYVGREIFHRHGVKVGHITALDPAGPLFENHGRNSVDRDDATFVDAIHTSAGNFLTGHYGMFKAVGHADFYPGGGSDQPRCSGWFAWLKNFPCKHDSAVVYYATSIRQRSANLFHAIRCESYDYLEARNCSIATLEGRDLDLDLKPNNEEDTIALSPMGFHVDWRARGEYYLPVIEHSPYSVAREQMDAILSEIKENSANTLEIVSSPRLIG